MAVGQGSGDDRARIAAEQALSSRLLDVTIDGARGILFNITGGSDLSLFEIDQAATIIRETAHPDVNMIFGAVIDETMLDQVRITVIATGFEHTIPSIRQMTQQTDRPVPKGRPVREGSHVSAERRPQAQPPLTQPRSAFRVDDLDIPTFLRKRQN